MKANPLVRADYTGQDNYFFSPCRQIRTLEPQKDAGKYIIYIESMLGCLLTEFLLFISLTS